MRVVEFKSFLLSFMQPLLIGIYPAIYLFANNTSEVPLTEFFSVLGILFFAIAGIYILCGVVFSSYQKASIFVSVFMFLFFIPFLIGEARIRARYLLVISTIILCLLFVYLLKAKQRDYLLSRLFVLPFGVLMIFASFTYFNKKSATSYIIKDQLKNYRKVLEQSAAHIGSVKRHNMPNIYYFILDAYASGNVLSDYFNYDLSWFLDSLKEKGFYVAEESKSNYPSTSLSLTSSLNMMFHSGPVSSGLLRYIIEHNNVIHLIKQFGYRYIHLSAPWGFSIENVHADELYRNSIFGPFTTVLFRKSLLNFRGAYGWANIWFMRYSKWLRYQIKVLKEMPLNKNKRPFFVFVHFLCPHPPFVFNRDGTEKSVEAALRDQSEGYVDQLAFISKEILNVINVILKKEHRAPIIILQGDHGFPPFGATVANKVREGELSENVMRALKQRYSILNAYYLPKVDYSKLYDSISPVNSFRFIFNQYFGTKFKLLPDHAYLEPDETGFCERIDPVFF